MCISLSFSFLHSTVFTLFTGISCLTGLHFNIYLFIYYISKLKKEILNFASTLPKKLKRREHFQTHPMKSELH
jgi:hypothetical protein